jgi:hypothetical protein
MHFLLPYVRVVQLIVVQDYRGYRIEIVAQLV